MNRRHSKIKLSRANEVGELRRNRYEVKPQATWGGRGGVHKAGSLAGEMKLQMDKPDKKFAAGWLCVCVCVCV